MEKRYDLHVHTIYSDGTFSPEEVISMAREKGLAGLAFTDHDNCDVFFNIEKSDFQDIDIITGIELSSKFKEKDIEILGYFFDYKNKDLQAAVDTSIYHRHKRIEEIVNFLRKDGIEITLDEVKAKAGGRVLVRPHIARVLLEKGYVGSVKEAFDKYLVSDKVEVLHKTYLSISDIIEIIHSAGGIAVLAHPLYYLKKMGKKDLDELFNLVVDLKIDGIEVFYPYTNVNKVLIEEVEQFSKDKGLLATGGSDFHGKNKKENSLGIRAVSEETIFQMKERLSKWR
jgi:predicted metal-dependent phosphoesterase TrpH